MKTQFSFIAIALTMTLLIASSAPVPAQAATLTVNTLIDENDGSCSNGDCSLRDAVLLANPGDTINFSVTGVMTLTEGEIVLNKNLVIQGPGQGLLAIDGNLLPSGYFTSTPARLCILMTSLSKMAAPVPGEASIMPVTYP